MAEPLTTDLRRAAPGGIAVASRAVADVAVLPPATRFIFRGQGTAVAACGAVFGVELPDVACRASVVAGRSALWLGPDEWLLIDDRVDNSVAAGALSRALAAEVCSLVDISHRQIGLLVSGPQAADLLNAVIMLDLEKARFPINGCARTLFGKAEIVLWRCAAHQFRIEVWRSFAGYVADMLAEAAFGLDQT